MAASRQVDEAQMRRFGEIEAALQGRWPESRIAPDLTRIAGLMDLLGDPQRAYPVIHLAGTNGKTSTARIVESLLRSLGLRTGLYTSPHLQTILERIRVEGDDVGIEAFLRAYDDVAPYLDLVDERSVAAGGPAMSFFETITGLAYALFADVPVEVAVIETGMGGTWDATNVVDATVAVVTPVALDHQEYLGDTIEAIAAEKAGIITAGQHAVLGLQLPAAAAVLMARVAEVEAAVVREGIDFGVLDRRVAVGGQLLTLQGLGGRYDELLLPLHGAHQAHNAVTALAAVESFVGGGADLLDPEAVAEGFAAVTSPGRLEVLRGSPTVVVDAAHNPHGALALVAAVQEAFSFTHLVGVVGVMGDKDAYGVLAALEPVLAELVVTANGSPRAMDADDLAAVAVDLYGRSRVTVVPRLADAIDEAVRLADEAAPDLGGGTGVLVTGSVVTAAEARRLLGPPT